MRKFFSAIILASLCSAQSIAAAEPVVPATTNSLPVGKCVNMGNHLEAPTEGSWGGRKIADDDFEIIAKAGFNTIRLPVRWSAHAKDKAPYTIDADFMARVKHVVGRARAAGLNVILDDHHFEELHKDPSKHAPKLAGMWTQIAAEFKDEPREHLWFEIANEPNAKLTHKNLLETLEPALAEIRKTNPHRPVIIGGENWSGVDSLATLPLPNDPHIIPTFHYYDPFDFTHQGATWVDNPPPMGRTFGGDADVTRLVADVRKVREYIKKTGKTPFMGETGANGPIPVSERVKYQASVHAAFNTIKIGMCVWGFTNTFPIWDSEKKAWVPGMLNAMGLQEQ